MKSYVLPFQVFPTLPSATTNEEEEKLWPLNPKGYKLLQGNQTCNTSFMNPNEEFTTVTHASILTIVSMSESSTRGVEEITIPTGKEEDSNTKGKHNYFVFEGL